MKPTSRVIQLIYCGEGLLMVALCEDGSVWSLDGSTGRFSFIAEMEDGRYLIPGNVAHD